jgi:PD-(D/E)XK nuclease superfamily protein
MAFLHKASSLGVGVAKPFGDNERYDFILDSGERLWRVQVKSTCLERGGGYRTWGRGSNEKPYKASEIDFLVAYIIPRNIWYSSFLQAANIMLAISSPTAKLGTSWRRAGTRPLQRGTPPGARHGVPAE